MNFENLPEWNYKSEELDDSTEKDRDERPPLKGNTRRIPMGLYEEPWDKVTDAYGSAELTPFYIEGLGSDNKADREFAIFGLYSATTHQGSVYESARMAIPFLVDMLKAEKEDDTILASHFLARIAVGENHFIRSPKYVDRCRSEYFNDVFEFKNILRAFYEETDNPEIMRLLCFYPHELPDYVLPKKKIKDEILATKLIVQGFIAAERNLKEHKTEVEEYMLESDSLLVRLSAAVCLAYSNLADDYCKKLLLHLSEMDLNYTPWVWEFDASQLAKYAWIYAADFDELLKGNHFPNQEQLAELVKRYFPNNRSQPWLYSEINPNQKKVIEKAIRENINISDYYVAEGFNYLPGNKKGLLRLLKKDTGSLLDKEIDIGNYGLRGLPLWYILEKSYSDKNEENALKALHFIDSWSIAKEVFEKDRITLTTKYLFWDDAEQYLVHAHFISIFANSLFSRIHEMKKYLDKWLEKIPELNKNEDWGFKTESLLMGIALLTLARTNNLSEKYYPLVRPYHRFLEHSRLPISILNEILLETNMEHQRKVFGDNVLFSINEGGEDYEPIIKSINNSWELLKGCKGDWVIEKISKSVAVWADVKNKNPSKFIGVFPYKSATDILKRQGIENTWDVVSSAMKR